MTESITIRGDDNSDERAVVLSIPRRSFGDFIQGLLGEPRRIERKYKFRFVVDLNNIANLDAVVMQRVTQQHQARLIDFQARIYFENGTRKTLPSREALLSFGDNSYVKTIGISIVWIFLIQFPHSKIPEKQAIRFRAFSRRRLEEERFNARFSDFDELSSMQIEIEHTEVTWGDDVFNHLDREIVALRDDPAILEVISIRLNRALQSGYTILMYFSLVFVLLFSDWRRHYQVSAQLIKEKIAELSKTADPIAAIGQKLDFYFGEVAANSGSYFFVIVFEFALFILLLVAANSLSDSFRTVALRPPSVILNSATRKLVEKQKQDRDLWIGVILVAFIINVLAALALNPIAPYIFSLFEKTFALLS
jgi:hypothetical protein